MNPRILIADDHKATRQSIRMLLTGEPYDLLEAADLDAAYEIITKESPDLVLLDIHFENKRTSISLLKRLASEQITIPIIMLSGAATASEAADAIKYGAHDYLEKPVPGDRLKLTLSRGLEYARLKQQLQSVTIQKNSRSELIGRSDSIIKIRRQIGRFAPKDMKILITGETGTGKEVIAHNIWQNSSRSTKPFIIVNCAALPENLMESELFGHKRGAFTGAHSDQVGKIEMAHQGTLFLDEIGELSLSAQTKLLRFLESGEVQKVGASEIRKVDVRLIAATSRDLKKELASNHFRSDLFYRLNVVTIEVPPLSERSDDVPLLFSYFVKGFCKKYEEPEKLIDQDALQLLQCYPWPGNVRELRNIAEKAVVGSGNRILAEHIREMLPPVPKETGHRSTKKAVPLREFKAQAEREYILSVLHGTGGSITEAAKVLGIDRTYLHQKMTQLKIDRTDINEAT